MILDKISEEEPREKILIRKNLKKKRIIIIRIKLSKKTDCRRFKSQEKITKSLYEIKMCNLSIETRKY